MLNLVPVLAVMVGELAHHYGFDPHVGLIRAWANGDPIPVGPDCEVARTGAGVPVPASAVLKPLELSWPTPDPSGIN